MPKPPVVYDAFNPPPDVPVMCKPEEKRTKDEFIDECNVNVIMRNYEQKGILPSAGPVANYGDFVDAPDFIEAQNMIARSRQQFEALPAEVRARFANDPAAFLAFVHDERNLDEAEKLGLLSEEAVKRRKEVKPNAPVGESVK